VCKVARLPARTLVTAACLVLLLVQTLSVAHFHSCPIGAEPSLRPQVGAPAEPCSLCNFSLHSPSGLSAVRPAHGVQRPIGTVLLPITAAPAATFVASPHGRAPPAAV